MRRRASKEKDHKSRANLARARNGRGRRSRSLVGRGAPGSSWRCARRHARTTDAMLLAELYRNHPTNRCQAPDGMRSLREALPVRLGDGPVRIGYNGLGHGRVLVSEAVRNAQASLDKQG